MAELSTKPYLIRAIHQWCEDSGYRPYLAVMVDERTQVPREFVRNGEIVLNVSAVATNRLVIGNDLIEFEARFSGTVRQVSIPIENVSAIYAQETGHGMAFDVPKPLAIAPDRAPSEQAGKAPPVTAAPKAAPRPKLVPPPAARDDASPDTVLAGAASSPSNSKPSTAVVTPPALQAVESDAPSARPPKSTASRSRRRGKLAAVPDSDSSRPPDSEAATSPPKADEQAPAPHPEAAGDSPIAPDEPPPTPPARPQLKRIK